MVTKNGHDLVAGQTWMSACRCLAHCDKFSGFVNVRAASSVHRLSLFVRVLFVAHSTHVVEPRGHDMLPSSLVRVRKCAR